MIMTVALLDHHVVADLPADTVPVVVPGCYLADGDVRAALQEDATRIVAIEVVILGPVAVECEILDGDVANLVPTHNRKERGSSGFTRQPEVLSWRAVQLKTPAGASNERPLDDRRAAVMGISRPQANAISHLKSLGVHQRDLLIVPVRIGSQAAR